MIRMFQVKSADHAKNYFRDSLSRSDYYIADQELNGTFNGQLAKHLGIEGKEIDKETFGLLCDNINPKDGQPLTPRTVANRRVGYDISFHCPKSVSILHALSDDDKVLEAFKTSVHETMREMEADMQTRVRVDGQSDDRPSRNFIWADFIHQTARPVDGQVPDPHLHCHAWLWNASYCPVEERIKAGQFHNIKKDMPYYQARFQKRLADKLQKQGYGIRKTNTAFEVTVIPQRAIDLFSKRTNHIGQVAKEKGITNARELDKLGARTRAKKQKDRTMPELQSIWREDLVKAGIDETAKEETKNKDDGLTAQKTIDYAIDHSFSRASVKRERQLLAEGYKYAVDNTDISLNDIDNALQKETRVFQIQSGSQTLCTTALVLQEERTLISYARDGVGQFKPLNPEFSLNKKHDHLGAEQQTALKHVLNSQDFITMVRGGAGTGKTTLIKEAVNEIEQASGKQVLTFAPTSTATNTVLKGEGFEHAYTTARLLIDENVQEQIKDQVIWIDEAGMIGTKDMAEIAKIADQNNARIVLSGDPRQHPAVDRGDGMRILRDVGQLPQVSLETIYRQQEERYQAAVFDISKGHVMTGFQKLDDMGAIQETDYEGISSLLTQEYLAAREDKKTALVISPTREQTQKVNQEIRQGLREKKQIAQKERTVTILEDRYLTDPQKQDPRLYHKGDFIQTCQNMSGIRKGSTVRIDGMKGDVIVVTDKVGQQQAIPMKRAKDFAVYRPRDIQISKGDEIRITRNSYDENGKRLDNGTVLTIKRLSKKHGITAVKHSKNKASEFKLGHDFVNFDHAYCSTSYSAQSRTVDKVFINQPSVTFAASNQNQFYVSTSRGRESVTIYTDDKESLLGQIQKSGDRLAATELIKDDDLKIPTIDIDIDKQGGKSITHDKDYEPEL